MVAFHYLPYSASHFQCLFEINTVNLYQGERKTVRDSGGFEVTEFEIHHRYGSEPRETEVCSRQREGRDNGRLVYFEFCSYEQTSLEASVSCLDKLLQFLD